MLRAVEIIWKIPAELRRYSATLQLINVFLELSSVSILAMTAIRIIFENGFLLRDEGHSRGYITIIRRNAYIVPSNKSRSA